MDGQSFSNTEDKLQKLKTLLPEAFTEDKIDWEKLKIALGDNLSFENERYHLNWAGKSDAFRALQQRTSATLKPVREESVNFDTTENVFIEGENLEVLKILQKSYFGKIKMIYIDPPYNTGNDSFIYPDKFSETKDEYLKKIGDKDEEGYLLKEGMFRKNSKDGGHYHSNWLTMMYPRLYIARNLLKEDGVIFVSIDDNEVHNLRMIMNEIFGEENFISSIIWQKKYAASNDAKGIATMHDYIIAYQKTNKFIRNLFPRTEKQDALYKYDDYDGKGLWRSDNLLVKSYSADYVFPILNPNTDREYYPPAGSCWRGSKETIETWLKEKRIFFGRDGKGAPQLKRYLNEVQQGIVPTTWWDFQFAGHNDEANKELKKIFELKAPFDTPKPTKLIKRLLQIVTMPDTDEIILDFFSGSGTTAQAVIELNKEDNGKRKFMLVQLSEKIDDKNEAFKAGFQTVADICKERIRRVHHIINKVENHSQEEIFNNDQKSIKIDTGFKIFKYSLSCFKHWRTDVIENNEDLYKMVDIFDTHLKEKSEKEDLLYELILKSGYLLTDRVEEKEGYYSIDNNKLIIVVNEITQVKIDIIINSFPKPLSCIILDVLFNNNDQLKSNAALQMEDAGIELVTL